MGKKMLNESRLGNSLWMLLAAAALGAGACSDTEVTPSSGYGGSGGSGLGGSGGSGYTPPTCGHECQDYLVSFGVVSTIWFVWNQSIAGHPSGTKDTLAPCPLGGSAHITGTTSVSDTGIDTVDVVVDLDGCANSDEYYDLTFTGAVAMTGSFDTDFGALMFSSPSLEATGGIHVYDDPEIDQTCEFSVAQQYSEDSGTLKGRVCGRPFNSETAFDNNDGTGGSGGSGQGGSGGGTSSGGGSDCRCFCPDDSECTGSKEQYPCGIDSDGIPNVCGCPVNCP